MARKLKQYDDPLSVYDVSRFLTLIEAPNVCDGCHGEGMLIPADVDTEVVYEFSQPVSNMSVEPMVFVTTVCTHCGRTTWYWKQTVVMRLNLTPWEPDRE